MKTTFLWKGLVDYNEAQILQHQYVEKLLADQQDNLNNKMGSNNDGDRSHSYVLGMEHPPVVTLGYRLQEDQFSLSEKLQEFGFRVVSTDRGGQITLHSLGQLVVYPIWPLELFQISLKEYVSRLESSLQKTFSEWGIFSFKVEGQPGLYTQNGKIAFVGLRLYKGIVYHGISVNINNDLSFFQEIIPCGVSSQKMDKLENYSKGVSISSKEFYQVWCQIWEDEFC